VRIGVTLPQFEGPVGPALAAARRAEQLGLDGVFCFDHLWPLGQPGRPALSSAPLLGALAASTSTIWVGSLVARIGLVPDDVLASVFVSLATISNGRMIAGIGTGDHLSRAENDAFGIPFEPADERRARLFEVAAAVLGHGLPVWVGGGLPKTVELAQDLGCPVNLWEGDPLRIAELTAVGTEVTWGGPTGRSVDQVSTQLGALAAAGVTWAVCAWPESLEVVAEAAELVRAAH
jgi:Luciferase-like monooxygenase